MISQIHRYMLVQTLFGLAIAAATISGVILLVDFVEQSRNIDSRLDVSAFDLASLTLLKAPSLIESTLQFIFLFGVLMALFRLNRRSEIVVMRGSGISAWRILTAPMILSIVVGLLGAMALNPLAAAGIQSANRLQDVLMNVQRIPGTDDQVWLREANIDGYTIIEARTLRRDEQVVEDVTFLYFNQAEDGVPSLLRRINAPIAYLRDGYWEVEAAVERLPESAATQLGQVRLPTSIDRQVLFEQARSPEGVSFWLLPSLIDRAERAGLASENYQLRWHSLLALPLTLLASTLIAAAATMRLHRLGGATTFALAGGLGGFVMFFLQELLGSIGSAGALPPITAAWAAPALTALLALIYIASTEDG
ncbi:MAG: LptF/LptG family permease [Alphaproteobacteria bacterium]|nr:LptF/LptG family permease [Alphaproteobacteria bacterium]